KAKRRDGLLHVHMPSIGHFAHAERHERVAAYRAEWAHVGVAHAVEKPGEKPDQLSGDELMPGHAARLAAAAGARGDNKVAIAVRQRPNQHSDDGRIVGAVAVHEDDNLRVRRLRAGETSASITAA